MALARINFGRLAAGELHLDDDLEAMPDGPEIDNKYVRRSEQNETGSERVDR